LIVGRAPAAEVGDALLLSPMKLLLRFLPCVLIVGCVFASALRAADSSFPRKKILVFTKSSGFEHDAIKDDGKPGHGFAFTVLKEIAAAQNLDLTFSKDGSLFTPEYLAQFDAYLFYTTGDLTKAKNDEKSGDGHPPMTPAGKAALLQAIAAGKGFIATHSSTDCFHSFGRNNHVPERFNDDGDQADDYIKMLGGEFIRHGAQQTSHVIVADPNFPGASAVPAGWAPLEEWYSLKDFAPDLHAILVQDTGGMKGAEYARPNYPNTWARKSGKGHVFYTSLGHRDDIWTSPVFKSVLTGGINWALGRVQADVTPNLATAAPGASQLPKYVAPAPAKKKGETPKANPTTAQAQ
jgi:uncharacterized protein